ncbi:MAG: hypothetical protein H0W81_11000 [Chloroflexi bacterium]|nr:hypothetical protein [Chloroflexota bacterium]
MSAAVTCPGCRASVPDVAEMREHPYVGSAPGCWLLYSEVLAREYGDLRYTPAHQLTVDAYAVLHPGVPERRTAQSVAIHLVGLCLSLERGRGPGELPRLRQRLAAPKRIFPWLEPPASVGELTITQVHAAETPEADRTLVDRWARSAWEAWSAHHEQVRTWADELG